MLAPWLYLHHNSYCCGSHASPFKAGTESVDTSVSSQMGLEICNSQYLFPHTSSSAIPLNVYYHYCYYNKHCLWVSLEGKRSSSGYTLVKTFSTCIISMQEGSRGEQRKQKATCLTPSLQKGGTCYHKFKKKKKMHGFGAQSCIWKVLEQKIQCRFYILY